MNEKRKGEIALKVVKFLIRKRGVRLSPDSMREVGNISKETGVPVEELNQFAKPLIQELLDECFATKK